MPLEDFHNGLGPFKEKFVGYRFAADSQNPRRLYYQRCTFIECGFAGELDINFEYCRFVNCNFLYDRTDAVAEVQRLHFNWCEIIGRYAGGREGGFFYVRLRDSRIINSLLSRMNFGHTTEFERVQLENVRGLPSCTGVEQVRVIGDDNGVLDADLRALPVGFLDRYASWERLRTLGRLPLFGTSVAALVAIPFTFFLLAVYNEQLARVQARASAGDVAWGALVAALQPIPVPALSFWLLVSTLLLGIGSTLFALLCPSRVREFSLDRWTDELRQPALRYLPQSWSRRWARAIAAPCYVIGGGGTAIILLVKIWNAGEFIWRNSVLGF